MNGIKYSETGNDEMDGVLHFLSGDSEKEASKFKFNIGDIVCVEYPAGGSPKEGTIAQIRGRRNGYPEPYFHGYWFPLYFLEHLDGNPGGGEIGENCLRPATEDEIKKWVK